MAPHITDNTNSTTTMDKESTPKDNVHTKTALEALSHGPTIPGPPSFTSIEKHRAHILQHMAGAFRVFARKGYTEGLAGHISVRDPENPHTFWTNPLGKHWSLIRASDMVLVDYDGKLLTGNATVNAAGFLIHGALHKARPDVNAACHAHSPYGKAWSAFAKPLEMLNQDVCVFYGSAQSVYEDFGGVVFKEEEGERVARALGEEGKGMVLANHGLLTVGRTVDEAAYLFTLMERSCMVQLTVEAAAANGLKKRVIGDEEAKYTFEMTADTDGLYCEFQGELEVEDVLSNGDYRK